VVGRRDEGLTRDEAPAHARAIIAATAFPVSADLENGLAARHRVRRISLATSLCRTTTTGLLDGAGNERRRAVRVSRPMRKGA
jgi:2-methylisocitrate lyase-like PEP mutase family enzyme